MNITTVALFIGIGISNAVSIVAGFWLASWAIWNQNRKHEEIIAVLRQQLANQNPGGI